MCADIWMCDPGRTQPQWTIFHVPPYVKSEFQWKYKWLRVCVCMCVHAHMHCGTEERAQDWKSDGSNSNRFTSLSLRVLIHKIILIKTKWGKQKSPHPMLDIVHVLNNTSNLLFNKNNALSIPPVLWGKNLDILAL